MKKKKTSQKLKIRVLAWNTNPQTRMQHSGSKPSPKLILPQTPTSYSRGCVTFMLMKDMWCQLKLSRETSQSVWRSVGDQPSRGLLSPVTSWAKHPPATLIWKSSSLRPSCLLRPSSAKELLTAPMFPGPKAGTPSGPNTMTWGGGSFCLIKNP